MHSCDRILDGGAEEVAGVLAHQTPDVRAGTGQCRASAQSRDCRGNVRLRRGGGTQTSRVHSQWRRHTENRKPAASTTGAATRQRRGGDREVVAGVRVLLRSLEEVARTQKRPGRNRA